MRYDRARHGTVDLIASLDVQARLVSDVMARQPSVAVSVPSPGISSGGSSATSVCRGCRGVAGLGKGIPLQVGILRQLALQLRCLFRDSRKYRGWGSPCGDDPGPRPVNAEAPNSSPQAGRLLGARRCPIRLCMTRLSDRLGRRIVAVAAGGRCGNGVHRAGSRCRCSGSGGGRIHLV
jgi:hypothetical protein